MSFSRFVETRVASNDSKSSSVYDYQSHSLDKALDDIEPSIDALLDYMVVAKEHCYYPNERRLTKDESASVYLYTMEWGEQSFYRVLRRDILWIAGKYDYVHFVVQTN